MGNRIILAIAAFCLVVLSACGSSPPAPEKNANEVEAETVGWALRDAYRSAREARDAKIAELKGEIATIVSDSEFQVVKEDLAKWSNWGVNPEELAQVTAEDANKEKETCEKVVKRVETQVKERQDSIDELLALTGLELVKKYKQAFFNPPASTTVTPAPPSTGTPASAPAAPASPPRIAPKRRSTTAPDAAGGSARNA